MAITTNVDYPHGRKKIILLFVLSVTRLKNYDYTSLRRTLVLQ
jgi:hypothetical protein